MPTEVKKKRVKISERARVTEMMMPNLEKIWIVVNRRTAEEETVVMAPLRTLTPMRRNASCMATKR